MFQSYFVRDFPYGTDPSISVLNQDITNAFNLVDYTISQSFWPDQNSFNIAYFYLAAHFLVVNLRNSSQGISGQYAWLTNSKAAGGISQGIAIPERIMQNPDFAQYFTTNYGAQYMSMLWPNLSAQVFTVAGRTKP